MTVKRILVLANSTISRKYFPIFRQSAEGYSKPNDPSQILLCISLTPPFKDGLHYKAIATVFELSA